MLLDYLPRVKIPAFVVSGADDVVFPSGNANELADELRHTSLVIIPDAGYGAITQDEPAFVAAVEKFTG
jgi:pimeloyl-ACP methyl ester carboxylesterase